MTAFRALADTLEQLANAILPLTETEYTRRDLRSSGSIGAHVRHALDHVWALERGIATGQICYDHRERDTVVEHEPQLGLSRLKRAMARLGTVGDEYLDRPLTITAQVGDRGHTIHTHTTVARELTFVISHTVHHNALIAVLLEQADHEVPLRFGLAPTTPVTACVR